MQLTGRITITVKGQKLRSKEGSTLKYGDVEREGVAADTGVAGYTEKTSIPEVECVIAHAADISLKELQAITAAEVQFITDTGKSFILADAWCAGALELSKGEVKLKFQGMKCEEN